ncbi:FAD-binding oxidoreductase [Sphingomonas sp. ID0503]|uniref:FAD-binding oxidoreductase n=1 Tax=Sphingomonas sp. ID0503 TaxID=3399691 RepID=UPI003AFAA14E
MASHIDIVERLTALLGPRGITTDPQDMEPWLTDWRGRYSGRALALVSPADTAEVSAVVKIAGEAGVPIVPQGGNTSMVGGATPDASGSAIILSLRRMNAIRALSLEDASAVVEAGVILSNLHDAAAAVGWRFPLSLAAKGSATIGGLVSTNAGGTQVLRFGTMRSLVLGVEAVMPDGSVYEGLSALRKDNRGLDLKHLLIGTEGTLGIVTAASLRIVPAAGERMVAWLGLPSAEAALTVLRGLEAATGEAVESFELVPDVGLQLVLQHLPGTRAPLAGAHGWHVLVEVTGPKGAPVVEQVEAALGEAIEAGLVEDAAIAANDAQAEAFWHLRESVSEAERIDGMAAKHDIAVPVARMARFITEATPKVEDRFAGARVLAFGHLGDGNIHFNVRAPAGADSKAWLAETGAEVSAFVHDLVAAEGGSLSAEHGIGQMKRVELARLGNPVQLAAMRAVKAALDPQGLMNPGKLIP